jgi:hypothetical protein
VSIISGPSQVKGNLRATSKRRRTPAARRAATKKRGRGFAREAREKQTFARVRSIVDQALCRPRDNFGVDEALIELEEARICALSVFPPQSNAAVAATMAKAKLLGLIIDRQEVGSPKDYECLGSAAVERFKKIVSEIKEIPVIEDRSNGNDEG